MSRCRLSATARRAAPRLSTRPVATSRSTTVGRSAMGSSAVGTSASAASIAVGAGSRSQGATEGSAAAGSGRDAARAESESGARDEGRGFSGFPGPKDLTIGALLLILMAALLGLAGLAFALAAAPSRAVPAGRLRHFVVRSRSNLAFTGLVALAATVAVLLAGALF